MAKKIAVLKRGYEYDDNYYSHDGNIEIENSKIFNTIEEAEAFRKEATFEDINDYPTEGNLRNVLNGSDIDIDRIIDIINEFSGEEYDEDSYEINISEELLADETFKTKMYEAIKDVYYIFVDIEVNENSSTLSLDWESEYETKYKYQFIIGEQNDILLHSTTEPAKIQKDDYDEYIEYYLKGKQFEKKADWLSECRKYKIDNVLKSEE